jgi:hypothetical protein
MCCRVVNHRHNKIWQIEGNLKFKLAHQNFSWDFYKFEEFMVEPSKIKKAKSSPSFQGFMQEH